MGFFSNLFGGNKSEPPEAEQTTNSNTTDVPATDTSDIAESASTTTVENTADTVTTAETINTPTAAEAPAEDTTAPASSVAEVTTQG